jgi:hypothetical protein
VSNSFIVTLASANETGGKSFISGVQNAGLALISSGCVGFSVKLPGGANGFVAPDQLTDLGGQQS